MNKIIHKRSSTVLDNGQPKLPTSDKLDYGEIALNFAENVETISIKNKANDIVEFKPKSYYDNYFQTKKDMTGYTTNNTFNTLSDDVDSLKAEQMKVKTLDGYSPSVSVFEENTYYICTSPINMLTFQNFQNDTSKPVSHYKVFFNISTTAPTISFPTGITWAYGEVPVITDTTFSYEVDIEKIIHNGTVSYRGIVVRFK